MYRTVSWKALVLGISPDDAPDAVVRMLADLDLHYRIVEGRPLLFLNGTPVRQAEIRSPQVAAIVSQVARIPGVRSWLLGLQRECKSLGRIVMEGRDIATVIFPNAKFKFFITASPLERARRRLALTEMHQYAQRGYTPKVKPRKGCGACSLQDVCLPKLMGKSSVEDYVKEAVEG